MKIRLALAIGATILSPCLSVPTSAQKGDAVEYRVLATSKTSTMQKEMQEAGDAGFEYRGQTVFKSAFGGNEVVAILEKSMDATQTGCSSRRRGRRRLPVELCDLNCAVSKLSRACYSATTTTTDSG